MNCGSTMTIDMRQSRIGPPAGRALIVLLLIGLVFASTAQSASATYSQTSCVGATSWKPVVGFTQGPYPTYHINQVAPGDIRASRSTCSSGDQQISVVFTTYGYSPQLGWVVDLSWTNKLTVKPGYAAPFSFVAATEQYLNIRASAVVTWRTSTGQLLGQLTINYNGPNDFYCPVLASGYSDCVIAAARDASGSLYYYLHYKYT